MTERCTMCVPCIRTGHAWCRCDCHTIHDHTVTDVDREEAHNPDLVEDWIRHGGEEE